MVDIARLQIRIDSDGVTIAGRRLDDLARRGTQVGRTLTTRLTLPLVAGFTAAVREAGLLEGAIDKFDVVFQGMNDEMMQFVDGFNKEFPIARRHAVAMAASMQDLLVPMGINRDMAMGMTQEWMQLAGALSAFNDVPIEQALEAIRSGIAGQSRPLRQFGIDVRETVLQQTALEHGLIRAGQAMNEQVRQQALLIQATNQSADAIGGLEQQKGSLLWVVGELKRDFQDFLAIIGEDLLPVAKDMIGTARDWAQSFQGLDENTRRLAIQAGLLAAAIGPATLGISWAFRIMIPLATSGTKAVRALTAAMVANPYLAVGAAVLALGGWIAKTEIAARGLTRELNSILGGSAEDMNQVNQAIADLDDRINRSSRAISGMGIDPEETDTIKEMRAQLADLVSIRDQMALNQIDEIISGKATQEVNEAVQAVERLIERVDGVRTGPPIDNIIDPIEEANIRELHGEYQDFQDTIDDLIRMPPLDLGGKMFDPGSIGFIEEHLDHLENKLRAVTDAEDRERIIEQIKVYRAQLKALRGDVDDLSDSTDKADRVARELGFTFSSTFEDAIVTGNLFRDVLEGIFQDILRITTRTLVTEPLGNALTGALSGAFRGSVTSVNDALITSKGDVVKFHPDDNILAMKDMSKMGGSKVNVNVSVVNHSNAEVEIQERQTSNGDVEILALVREAVKSAHNSGQMDRTMSSNYGVTRKGVRRG